MTESGTTAPDLNRCPLCDAFARVKKSEIDHLWTVDCAVCMRFTVDDYLMNVIRQGREHRDDRVCRLLPLLSQAAQDTWETGGRLNLAGENWQAIAHDAQARHATK
jgi:hypothetical protein